MRGGGQRHHGPLLPEPSARRGGRASWKSPNGVDRPRASALCARASRHHAGAGDSAPATEDVRAASRQQLPPDPPVIGPARTAALLPPENKRIRGERQRAEGGGGGERKEIQQRALNGWASSPGPGNTSGRRKRATT
jgi:hypothetical protein